MERVSDSRAYWMDKQCRTAKAHTVVLRMSIAFAEG